MHLSMSSQRGEEAGHRVGFWHFPKHCCQIPYPQAKMWGQIYLKFPAREMICDHGHEQKFKYPYPRDSKIIQIPYPWAKAIDQNPALDSCIIIMANIPLGPKFWNILPERLRKFFNMTRFRLWLWIWKMKKLKIVRGYHERATPPTHPRNWEERMLQRQQTTQLLQMLWC